MKLFFRILMLLTIPVLAGAFEMRGALYRSDTREPLASVMVILVSGTNEISRTQSEENGNYILSNIDGGDYTAEFRLPGFYGEKKVLSVKGNISLNVYMTPQSSLSLGEVDVIGEKEKDTASKNTLDKSIREKASASITGDAVGPLTKMPGVQDLGMGNFQNNTKLSVRGGSGNENLAFLDEAVIPNPYHRFTGDSVFIDDIVQSITLYKGVIPAEYGQAMSSMLDVKTEEGTPGLHGKINIGLLNTYLTLSGASADQKWNWAGGIRRTQYDLIFKLFMHTNDPSQQIPYYLDSHGRIQYKEGGDIVSFDWQYSSEPGFYSNNGLLNPNSKPTNYGEINFTGAVLNMDWKHNFDRALYLQQAFGWSWSYQLMEILEPDADAYKMSESQNLRYKTALGYEPFEWLQFKAGAEVIYYPKIYFTNSLGGSFTNQLTLQPEWKTFSSNSYNGQMGMYAVFLQNETEFFDNKAYIEDGIRMNYSDFIKKYSIDPRLTIGYRFSDRDKIYVAAGYLSQFPDDAWTLSFLDTNSDLSIPGCWHYVAGTEWGFMNSFDVTVEAYYKQYEHYPTEGTNSALLYQTEGFQRHVYGFEVLLMKKKDSIPVYGWISFGSYFAQAYLDNPPDPNALYSLNPGSIAGGSSITVAGQYGLPPVKVWYNDGSQDYKLDITAVWDISKNWSLTSEFQYSSGSYYTPVIGTKEAVDPMNPAVTNILPVFGEYNSEKMPDQHSLNLKIEFFWDFCGLPAGAFLQVNNVYNYRPALSYNYKDNYKTKEAVVFPIGIYPLLGLWMKW